MLQLLRWPSHEKPGRIRSLAPHEIWLYAAVVLLTLANVALMCLYQSYVHVDFPYSDEWGYLYRLIKFVKTGSISHIMDPYWGYTMPMYFIVMYLFYAFTSLDFMAMRFFGAALLGVVAVCTALIMIRRSPSHSLPVLLTAVVTVLYVFSLNTWATYHQAIESVMSPLLLGNFILAAYRGERLACNPSAMNLALIIAFALFAVLTHGAGVSLLPALVFSRLLLVRKIDRALVILALSALLIDGLYLMRSAVVEHASKSFADVTLDQLPAYIPFYLALLGTSVLVPSDQTQEPYTMLIGVAIVALELTSLVYSARQGVRERLRFMIPVTLIILHLLIAATILVTRYWKGSDFGYAPRYASLLLCGPVGLLIMAATIEISSSIVRLARYGFLASIVGAVILADIQTLPYIIESKKFADSGRTIITTLSGQPDALTQDMLRLHMPLAMLAYPDKKFLEDRHLALFK